jgi:hypothetical protein
MSEESLDLYDSEVDTLLQILGRLQVKYGTRRATFENLNSMASEAMDLCEKAGFLVTVSVFDDNMQPKMPPEITVHARVDAELFAGFDPDRQQWETKKGVADDEKVKKFLTKGGTKKTKVDIEHTLEAPEKQAE